MESDTVPFALEQAPDHGATGNATSPWDVGAWDIGARDGGPSDIGGSPSSPQDPSATQYIESPSRLPRRRSAFVALGVLLAALIGAAVYFGLTGFGRSNPVNAASSVTPPAATAAPPVDTTTAQQPSTNTDTGAASSAPSTALSAGVPQAPVTTATPTASSPETVVQAYYDAINAGDYPLAWSLGGKNLGHGSYASFVQGFATTSSDAVTIVSTSGDIVTIQLDATQTDGTHRHFAGTYTVRNGTIVASQIQAQP
ncbi:nuclear transport factor 2 family protein [Actinocrinis puniceicyclus]|uniref:Nuclear transport factor 2 family protein n=1 Tax=Actinocrinis puniceicyclus TaxID=977794 RepID=A0A8J7WR36_9ACTN|nr:nuclear transport factor 2 family protein [Actinocrinis puniceicyclus]MBS2964619.1 nuclear transport factor 2 family protein [Actinocrinis puniceicyclus]